MEVKADFEEFNVSNMEPIPIGNVLEFENSWSKHVSTMERKGVSTRLSVLKAASAVARQFDS